MKVALGAMVLGATAGVVGAFAVLRKRSLVGDMLAHASLPGICLAFLIFSTRELWALSLGALIAGLVGVLAVVVVCRWTRTREDAAMGIVLSTFFGAGIVLMTVIQQSSDGSQAGLSAYLFGEIASLRASDVRLLIIVGTAALALVLLFYKELKLTSFDHDFAQSQGWPAVTLDFGVMAAVAVVTVAGLPICGVVLMAAMLIYPCAAARYWTNQLGMVLLGSGFIGAAAAGLGVFAASPRIADVPLLKTILQGDGGTPPPGPLIVLCGAAVFLASMLFAPRRGVLARVWRQSKTRHDVVRDHLLRVLFELTEANQPDLIEIPLAQLESRISTGPTTRRWVLGRAVRAGLLHRPTPDTIRFTPDGHAAAAKLTRAHRLWEQFLIEHADIAADHVHRPADDIEHLLPEAMIELLEAEIAAEQDAVVPESPHKIH